MHVLIQLSDVNLVPCLIHNLKMKIKLRYQDLGNFFLCSFHCFMPGYLYSKSTNVLHWLLLIIQIYLNKTPVFILLKFIIYYALYYIFLFISTFIFIFFLFLCQNYCFYIFKSFIPAILSTTSAFHKTYLRHIFSAKRNCCINNTTVPVILISFLKILLSD